MTHLSPSDVMDVIDGCAPAAAVEHADACGRCRALVAEARQGLEWVQADQIPEPSPLFWRHLEQRVARAVRDEGRAGRAWWPATWALRPVSVVLASVLTVAVGVAVWNTRMMTPVSPAWADGRVAGAGGSQADRPGAFDVLPDDESWSLVSQFVDDLSVDSGGGDLVTAPLGAADRAIPSLTDAERTELARLLKERLGES